MKALQKFFKGKQYEKVSTSEQNEKQDTLNINGEEFSIPDGHKNTDISQAELCPIMKMKLKQGKESQELQVYDPENGDLEKKKQKKMKGGCPFMPSEKKKNPGLQIEIEDVYGMLYISNRNYLLQNKGFNLRKQKQISRKLFDSYPIYLKHTLFHQDEPTMVKARKCEMSQKFFIYDQLREKGNKFLRKGDYLMALNCYEHALSVVRYLELLDEEEVEDIRYQKKKQQEKEEELKKQTDEKIPEQEEESKENEKEKEDIKPKLITKKTKKGANLYSVNRRTQEEKKWRRLQDENEEQLNSDSDNISQNSLKDAEDEDEQEDQEEEFKETEEQKQIRIERQAEQQKRQEELFKKAQQQMVKSSVPAKQGQEDDKDKISDSGSLERGVRSDDGFSDSDNISKQDDDDNDNDWEDHDSMRSDVAVGDDSDFEQRNKELEKEQRQEDRRKEEFQQLLKDEELQEEENDDEKVISMDKKDTEKEKQERAEEMMKMKDEDREFQKKYRLLLTTFDDENTVLRDGDELTDSHEIDMRQGMLITIFLNMSVIYQKMGYFQNAIEALEDAEKVAQVKCSQVYFRRSAAITHDLSSSLQKLQEAKKDIELAMQVKHTEKIFKQEKGILNILNISDHEEAYRAQAILVTDRIHKVKEQYTEKVKEFLRRAAQIEEIYQEMVEDGVIKDGEEDYDGHYLQNGQNKEEKLEGMEEKIQAKLQYMDDYKEKEIIIVMIEKYYGMIDFYAEQNKEDSVKISQQELQNILKIQNEMDFYYNLDTSELTKDEIVLEQNKEYKVEFKLPRVEKRLLKLKREYARTIYEEAQFNFHMLEYSIREYYKKIRKLRDRLDELKDIRIKDQKHVGRRGGDEKPGFPGGFSATALASMGGVFGVSFILFAILSVMFLGRQGFLSLNFFEAFSGYENF